MFAKTFVAAGLCLASVLPSVAALTVTGPSSTAYWVFGTANTITWTYDANDPSPASVIITNPDKNTLNGPFSVAQNVPASQKSIEVTDVTLKPGDGYVVNFVNPSNSSDIYAFSGSFTVKPQGTLPYGETVFTTVSYSVSGSVTISIPLTETSTSGITMSTGTATSNSTGSATTTTTTTAGPATATIITKKTSSGAMSSFTGMDRISASILMGVVVGALAVF
ncbi:hypothetical protein FRB94_005349 [Tulasnella sp. JGI-2019a]|nr:hypothetical protein FRB93_001947 [Tulasnella sp. JGI-2019a]KAG9000560.1 hypothetical protein FRB94_005349 [Tulasnella sp. JGI-2019a]